MVSMELPQHTTEPPKPDFGRYEDPSGDFDSKELKLSLWFVRHKVLLYRLTVGALIAVCIIEWAYSLASLGLFAAVGWRADQQLRASLANFTNYAQMNERVAAQPIGILSTQVVPGGVNKYDAVAEVVNPNDHFIAQFDYSFALGGTKTNSMHAVLLPGEDRLVPLYGIESVAYPGDATLVIEHLTWQRVSAHQVITPTEWQANRLNFQTSNFHFVPAESPESAKTNIITFDYFNNTAFSYREPSFVVGLYSHQTLVGVLPLTLPDFVTFETKKVDLRSLVNNLQVDEVRVFPTINVYDLSAYLPPPATSE